MEAQLAYGRSAVLNLTLPEERILASYGPAVGEPLDDLVASVAAAMPPETASMLPETTFFVIFMGSRR